MIQIFPKVLTMWPIYNERCEQFSRIIQSRNANQNRTINNDKNNKSRKIENSDLW